jgi:hypothetical protein
MFPGVVGGKAEDHEDLTPGCPTAPVSSSSSSGPPSSPRKQLVKPQRAAAAARRRRPAGLPRLPASMRPDAVAVAPVDGACPLFLLAPPDGGPGQHIYPCMDGTGRGDGRSQASWHEHDMSRVLL